MNIRKANNISQASRTMSVQVNKHLPSQNKSEDEAIIKIKIMFYDVINNGYPHEDNKP